MTDSAPAKGGEGKRLGRYLLRYLVAEGGMASVYLAQLPGPRGFEKWVALKVMHPHLARDRRFVQMFLDEACIAARIIHPNVCAVLDYGEDPDQGLPYLVMEYLHGETLSAAVKRGKKARSPLPGWLAARVAADAARGLHAAHELRTDDGAALGVVHRDVSPQNVVVLYDGVAKVLDFGVASLRGRGGDTKSNEVKGKLRYMAPEQLKRETVDRRTDVWALGVVLWEATLGKRLFQNDSEGAVVLAVLKEPIPRPSKVSPGYPEDLDAVVMKALEREPDRRYQTAAELADELERHLYSSGAPTGPAQVAEWLTTHFTDRVTARSALLRAPALPVEVIPEIDLGSLGHRSGSLGSSADSVVTPVETGRRRVGLALGIAAGVLILVGGALVVGVSAANRAGDGSGAGDPSHAAIGVPHPQPDAAPGDRLGGGVRAGGEGDAGPVPPSSPGDADLAVARRADGGGGKASRDPVRDETVRAAPGKLNLLAIPAASVKLRGRSLGSTPLFNVELPAGRHRLTLTPTGGGRSETITVEIRPGQTVRRSVRLGGS